MGLNPDVVERVQKSFVLATAAKTDLAAVFYDRLFAIAPNFREMFPLDMAPQQTKLSQTLAAAVANLDDLADIQGYIADLGVRHIDYGVKGEDYDVVGAALLQALSETLGAQFTPMVEAAWIEVYGLVAGAMKAAAENASIDR